MLVKFFAGGTGAGKSPVNYLIRETDSKGVRREPLPEVIKGNPNQTIQLIDSVNFKYKFHSGVISFAPEDNPTEQQQQELIESFEKTAFAGLEPDQYDILWVRHSHTSNGRIELHFVTPRVELTTGKSMSIAPPGWQDYYCHWRDMWNYQHQWSDPTDPARARIYQPGYQALRDAQDKRLELAGLPTTTKREDYRKLITNYITQQIELGNIQNRNDIITHLENADIEVTRQGEEYITVTNQEIGKKIRLKGGIYSASWGLEPELTAETSSRQRENRRDIQTRIREAEAKLNLRVAKRAELYSQRYPTDSTEEPTLTQTMPSSARGDRYEHLNRFLHRKLGDDALVRQPSLSNTATKENPSELERTNLGYPTLSDREREIYHPTQEQQTENQLEVSGQTLYQNLIQENERFRERTIADLEELRQTIRKGQEVTRRRNRQVSQTNLRLVQQRQQIERQSNHLEQQSRELNTVLSRHPEQLRKLEMKRNEELDRFKTQIDLVHYAQNNGYQPDKKKSSVNCIVLKDDLGDKILIGLDRTDRHYFYYSLTNETDKGSIIDFVQKRKNLNLGEVRKELRPWIQQSSDLTNSKVNSKAKNKIYKKSETKLIPTDKNRTQILLQIEQHQTINNHPYLNQRGIKKTTIDNSRFQGTIYRDKNNNVIFPHQDREGVSGYEIRNQKFKGFSTGGTKGLWTSRSGSQDRKLVICESPIDCLSYHQLFPDEQTRYFATSGTLSQKQKNLLQSAFEKISQKGGEIIIATDRDEPGKKLSQELAEIAPETAQISRHVPKYQKDWNEALNAQIEREIKLQQKQQRERGRDRGGLSL